MKISDDEFVTTIRNSSFLSRRADYGSPREANGHAYYRNLDTSTQLMLKLASRSTDDANTKEAGRTIEFDYNFEVELGKVG